MAEAKNYDKGYKEQAIKLAKEIKEFEKENKRLNELNEFLEEASAFFAASRQRSARKNEIYCPENR